MYNLSGLVYRIRAVGLFIFALGAFCLLLSCFWNAKKRDKKGMRIASVLIAISVVYSGYYIYKLYHPIILSHDGYFIEEHRDSSIAPPFPFTTSYTFSNKGGLKPVFYLDVFSKKKIYNTEFNPDIEYRIYYEKSTDIIVRVEILKNKD